MTHTFLVDLIEIYRLSRGFWKRKLYLRLLWPEQGTLSLVPRQRARSLRMAACVAREIRLANACQRGRADARCAARDTWLRSQPLPWPPPAAKHAAGRPPARQRARGPHNSLRTSDLMKKCSAASYAQVSAAMATVKLLTMDF